MIKILLGFLAWFQVKNADFFGENILKIITLVPGANATSSKFTTMYNASVVGCRLEHCSK
jgi:hypothetical protein